MNALALHRPAMATVLDWETEESLPLVMDWAQEASQYAEKIVVIPKVVGGIPKIPLTVNGKPIVLGYSVPSKFGATPCVPWEFEGREVHLLGGSPHRQMREWQLMRVCGASVVSADGNMHSKMATRHNRFWTVAQGRRPCWATLRDSELAQGLGIKQSGELWGDDAPYEAFRLSCINIMKEWKKL